MPWFQAMVGRTEPQWIKHKCPVTGLAGTGAFRTETIGSLWAQVKKLEKHGVPKLILRTRDNVSSSPELFDTSCLQAHAVPKTMVQVASNFHCQEVGSEFTDVYSGQFIHNLLHDCTQGPAAAGGAITAAMLRLSMLRADSASTDLLIDTELRHRNGKLDCTDDCHMPDIHIMRVGLQTDATVFFDTHSGGPVSVPEPQPVINQVFVATCRQKSNETPSELAGICLQAAYEGTYMCAALRQSRVLVLTAVGGESFRNNRQQIAAAMLAAHRKIGPYLHPDCQVIFPVYRPNDAIIQYLKKQDNVTFQYCIKNVMYSE